MTYSYLDLINAFQLDTIWQMSNLHITSIKPPFDDQKLAAMANTALCRADAMGLLSRPITRLDESAIEELQNGMAQAGIGQRLPSLRADAVRSNPARLSSLLETIGEVLVESPAPEHEWRGLHFVLGVELLARLLGISVASVHRYSSGNRTTPDRVAARLHLLAFVVGDLAGAYNDIGIRRWFDRPRTRLGGNSPAAELGKNWAPEEEGPRRVQDLAHSLVLPPVT